MEKKTCRLPAGINFIISVVLFVDRKTRILQHEIRQLCPVLTPVHSAHSIRRVMPAPIGCHLRNVRFEGRISMTHQYLSQISQAMLDMLGGVRSVDEKSDSDDV